MVITCSHPLHCCVPQSASSPATDVAQRRVKHVRFSVSQRAMEDVSDGTYAC